jgi:serine/threonine-protein kinase RIM15
MAGSPGGMSSAGGTSMMERKRSQLNESDNGSRRSSLPSRKRTSSLTGAADRSTSLWNQQQSQVESSSAGSSGAMMTATVDSSGGERAEESMAQSTMTSTMTANPSMDQITCLISEDNPISLKMLENILVKLGCVVSSVRNGAEALRLAMAETKFAVLFIDVTLPIVNGQDVARMIKSTRNINSVTPIIALASIDDGPLDGMGSVFDAVLAKPIEKADVCNILPRFGFKPLVVTSRAGSGGNGTTGGARRSTVAGLERVEGKTDEEQ